MEKKSVKQKREDGGESPAQTSKKLSKKNNNDSQIKNKSLKQQPVEKVDSASQQNKPNKKRRKQGATLAYSHGFNIVEEGMQIRKDLTVIMCAPKCPGSEVREEYKRGFGVPTLIAVRPENDPNGVGLAQAKAYAVATGGHRAGVLRSSFVAEVKSDLMGEQTILCGLLQTGSILSFNKMVEKGIDAGYASKLVQYGWEVITEALKIGGITHMSYRDWETDRKSTRLNSSHRL